MEYNLLLKDPRWQRKRLEILQRDDFTCRWCGDHHNTLQIHHTFYNFDLQPWEYPDSSLITLCDLCHARAEFYKWFDKTAIGYLKTDGFTSSDIEDIKGIVIDMSKKLHRQAVFLYIEDIKALVHG